MFSSIPISRVIPPGQSRDSVLGDKGLNIMVLELNKYTVHEGRKVFTQHDIT